MSIEYHNDEDVILDSENGVSIQNLNEVMLKLIKNDNGLVLNNRISPGLWEASWLNDSTIKGYDKGSAVWLNTDTIDNIVVSREADIYRYASHFIGLRKRLDELKNTDRSAYYQLMKRFVNGETEYSSQKLYFIGNNLNDDVQIRISRTSNNKTYPTDNDNWEDFFIRYSEDDVKTDIYSQLSSQLSSTLDVHVQDYHMNGIKEGELNRILLKDMQNVEYTDHLMSHKWYNPTLSGFDGVQYGMVKNFGNGCYKSFRSWRSGYLEHDGVIDVSNTSRTGDTIDGNIVTVRLNWDYSNGTAPSYDYIIDQIDDFYQTEKYISNGDVIQTVAKPSNGWTRRYCVNVNIVGNATPFDEYSATVYDKIEVYNMENDSFDILLPRGMNVKLSYHVSGYRVRSL